MEEKELYLERWVLALERIAQVGEEELLPAEYREYFAKVAELILMIKDTEDFIAGGGLASAPIEELARRNKALYEDIAPENYETSYANPTYAVKRLGEEYGQMLSLLYTEMRSLIGFVYEGDVEELAIRAELFAEVYAAFVYENEERGALPAVSTVKDIIYWFVSDYAEIAAEKRTEQLVTANHTFALDIINNSDLFDVRYLYAYGECVSESELATARFLASLPEETINTMADTYTEGYRIGFEVAGKPLAKKKTVSVLYHIGFERMIRRAVANFKAMGLDCAIYRAAYSILHNPTLFKSGFYGAEINRQFDFDHKDDKALFLDKNFVNRRLEVNRMAFEKFKTEAAAFAGPAVVETFGEKSFEPVYKAESLHLNEKQNALWVEFRSKAGAIQREYIIEDERSFTIIAFPVPEIGDVFEELFHETIRINTLDYTLYRDIQQTMIDALDKAVRCEVRGSGDNRTCLNISLCKLTDPDKQSIFENCVADVNIPVGEVFTSPVLAGTDGVLHVSRVFLNGLEYKNLVLTFKDGMISDYTCENFASEEENRSFVRENVLFRHKSLPMGEFAIGTNTTAYVAAKRLNVEDKMPILIAEKMGPHFAVGDTCYSYSEDLKVFNPDGKEIVARANEQSRPSDGSEPKYFNCHTDVTLPYSELGELTAVCADGSRIPIIMNGRFVLPGTEALNEPLDA